MRRDIFICLLLVVVTLAVFWQVKNHEFIDLDDDLYVSANEQVRAGLRLQGIVWAFTTGHAANWHPLTWLSHMTDCQLFGLNPGRHHLTSVVFHIMNAVLLFLLFRWMSGALWQSAFVAALFALHPLHVESVTWIAERKDVLSTFFWLLTMMAYFWYLRRPAPGRYLLALFAFASGLMAKPMLVTLPFVLLLFDYWPLRRLELGQGAGVEEESSQELKVRAGTRGTLLRLFVEKIPFFLLSGASSVMTFLVQRHGGTVQSMEQFGLQTRVANALLCYVRYLAKMVWPQHLAILYPHPGDALPAWQSATAAVLLVAVSMLVIRAARRHPYLLVGWLWYLGTLVPVIGLVQVGGQAMADRYTYVPLIGLFIMVAWGASKLGARWHTLQTLLPVLAVLTLTALGVRSWWQVQVWHDSISMFEHTLRVTSKNRPIHNNLGIVLARQGRLDQALDHFRMAFEINQNNVYARGNLVNAHINLGVALAQMQRPEEAVGHYVAALELQPDHPGAHNNLGSAFVLLGKLDGAAAEFARALEIEPNYAEAHNNLGVVLARRGKLDEAIAHFSQALRIKSDYDQARINLGIALQEKERSDTQPSSSTTP